MAKRKKEEKPALERTYTIPLRRFWLKAPRYKRAEKAVRELRIFLAKHMKVPARDVDKIKLDPWLNRALWLRSIRKPPHKITVKAIKGAEGAVKVELISLPPKYKVEEAALLKKKAKLEARVKAVEEKKKKEEEKRKEEEKKKAELEKEAKKEKTEEGKAEEKEKKEKEKILHKEIPKPRPEEIGVKKKGLDGKKEKQEMFRKTLEK